MFLGSYAKILFHLEFHLNNIYGHRGPSSCLTDYDYGEEELSTYWQKHIVGVWSDDKGHPWGETTCKHGYDPTLSLGDVIKMGDKYRFPVYAAGYNWLRSNTDAGTKIGNRIEKITQGYAE